MEVKAAPGCNHHDFSKDFCVSGEELVLSDPPSTHHAHTAISESKSLDRGRDIYPANPDGSDALQRGREFTPANLDVSEAAQGLNR